MGPTTRSYRREPQGRETPSAPSNMPASPRFATSSGWIFSQGIWFGSQDPTLRANTGTLHFLTAFPQTASSQESKSRPTTARATSGAQTRTSESTGRFSTRVLPSSRSYQSQTESPYLKWSMGTSNYIINIITLHFHHHIPTGVSNYMCYCCISCQQLSLQVTRGQLFPQPHYSLHSFASYCTEFLFCRYDLFFRTILYALNNRRNRRVGAVKS